MVTGMSKKLGGGSLGFYIGNVLPPPHSPVVSLNVELVSHSH